MENLYSYVFWYNSYVELWYAIPTLNYTEFFSGKKDIEGVVSSNKIDTLISIISNPSLIEENK